MSIVGKRHFQKVHRLLDAVWLTYRSQLVCYESLDRDVIE